MNGRRLACVLAVPAALLIVAVAAAPDALARREFAKKEGKECAFCHMNPRGGGPRNAKGREYEANGYSFDVKSWSSDANEQKYLRANSAIIAQWYAEAARLLDELSKEEKAKGGVALIDAAREKFKMFPAAWLHGGKVLIMKGSPGVPNAVVFFAKLETQFAKTDQGKDAIHQLDRMGKDPATKDAVDHARAVEKARQVVLEGITEFHLNHADKAKELLNKALADPDAKDFEKDVKDALAAIASPTPAK
jgi:hypothetical protein